MKLTASYQFGCCAQFFKNESHDCCSVPKTKQIPPFVQDYLEAVGAYVQTNYLQIKIFFGSRSVERVQEDAKYTTFSLMSSLGGATSLYLGISFVVLFEFFEVIVRLGMNLVGCSGDEDRKRPRVVSPMYAGARY